VTGTPAGTRTLALPPQYDMVGTLAPIGLGRHDPCTRWIDGSYWLAARTPDGAGSLALRRDGALLIATSYGPGAAWLLEHADRIAGLHDDLSAFETMVSEHPLVRHLAREHSGLRLAATGLLFHRLLRAVCEQKVTGKEAYGAYARIVRRFGTPAPGPLDGGQAPGSLLVPPDPDSIAATPYYEFHPLGLEQRRADTLRRAAAHARRLALRVDSAALTAGLILIRGIGRWTAAEVSSTVFGDPDAVSVGDYHLPNIVSWALAGEARGTDARMLELLSPFAGQRGRVCRLLVTAGIGAPRFGPRAPIRNFRSF
jgi:3-methyladenine DNA glycosylase/8-oxoguanine DNA glycosylase